MVAQYGGEACTYQNALVFVLVGIYEFIQVCKYIYSTRSALVVCLPFLVFLVWHQPSLVAMTPALLLLLLPTAVDSIRNSHAQLVYCATASISL